MEENNNIYKAWTLSKLFTEMSSIATKKNPTPSGQFLIIRP